MDRSLPVLLRKRELQMEPGSACCRGLQQRLWSGRRLLEAIRESGSKINDFSWHLGCHSDSGGAGASAFPVDYMGNFVLTNLSIRNPAMSPSLRFPEACCWKNRNLCLAIVVFESGRCLLLQETTPIKNLTFTPVAVADPLAVKRDRTTSAISFVTHAGAIGLILWMTLQHTRISSCRKKRL